MANAANSGIFGRMRPLLVSTLPLILACSGLSLPSNKGEPTQSSTFEVAPGAASVPAPDAGGVAVPPTDATAAAPANVPGSLPEIAARIVTAECSPPPFTDEEPTTPAPGRQAEVEAFLAKNPDAVAMVDVLVDALEASQGPVDAAYTRVLAELAAEPVELTVSEPNYQGVVVLNWAHNTSDDWAWFSNQVVASLDAAGVPNVNASPFQRKVRVVRAGAAPEVIDLAGLGVIPLVGYAVIQGGKPPVMVDHGLPEHAVRQISELLDKSIPLAPYP